MKSIEQIEEHIAIYEKYLSLQNERKDLLQRYKEAKEKQRIARVNRLDSQNSNLKSIDRSLGISASSSRANSAAKPRRTASYDNQMKEQLREWKEKKNADLAKEMDEKRQQEQIQKEKLKKRMEEDKNAKRELIEEYKFQKEMKK